MNKGTPLEGLQLIASRVFSGPAYSLVAYCNPHGSLGDDSVAGDLIQPTIANGYAPIVLSGTWVYPTGVATYTHPLGANNDGLGNPCWAATGTWSAPVTGVAIVYAGALQHFMDLVDPFRGGLATFVAAAGHSLSIHLGAQTLYYFQQPTVSDPLPLYIPQSDAGGKVPVNTYGFNAWQRNKMTANGGAVTSARDFSAYTGFDPAVRTGGTQKAYRDALGATVVQSYGDTVGIYMNTDDIDITSGTQVGKAAPPYEKMGIFPQYDWSPDAIPWAGNMGIGVELELHVERAEGIVNKLPPCFITFDMLWLLSSNTDIQISMGVKLYREQTGDLGTTFGIDAGYTGNYIANMSLADTSTLTQLPGCQGHQEAPWVGWKYFGWTISNTQFAHLCDLLHQEYPTVPISQIPSDWVLNHTHINAEMTTLYGRTGTYALGWSMRKMKIWAISPNAPPSSGATRILTETGDVVTTETAEPIVTEG